MTHLSLMRGALPLVVIAGVSCRQGSAGDQPDSPNRTLVPVEVAPVARDSLVESLVLTGRLEARPGGAALLAAPAAGVVRAVRVQVGDRVARGATVAELDVPELAADARQKTTAADQAEREAARQRQLLADGITSTRQVEEATAAAQQARAAAVAARDLLARTRIASPIAGRVQAVLAQRGERVDAGKPLVQIVAPDTLDLVVPVPAADLRRLSPGQEAVVMQEGDTVAVSGRVAALAPGVDSLTNAGAAVVRIPNPAGHLHPGAGATTRIRLGVRRQALVVPRSAIVLAGDSSVVFVVGADSVAHQRVVSRGIESGGRVEVRGSLEPGDRVVTTGVFGLQDGMRVAPSAERP
jgi:RND family efflux transporter MFP subunit